MASPHLCHDLITKDLAADRFRMLDPGVSGEDFVP
jgi:hypothetical protein